jgi:hypothetical protein
MSECSARHSGSQGQEAMQRFVSDQKKAPPAKWSLLNALSLVGIEVDADETEVPPLCHQMFFVASWLSALDSVRFSPLVVCSFFEDLPHHGYASSSSRLYPLVKRHNFLGLV